MMVSRPPICHSIKSRQNWTRWVRQIEIFESNIRFNLVSNSLTWVSKMITDNWQHMFFTSQQRNLIFFHTHEIIHVMFIAILHMLLCYELLESVPMCTISLSNAFEAMSLLLNDHRPAFITKQFSRFFDQYNAQSVLKQLNEQDYYKLHQKLLHQPTQREKRLQAIPTDDVAQMPESMMRKKHGIRTFCMLLIISKADLVPHSGLSFELGGEHTFVDKDPKLPMWKWNFPPRVIEHWNNVLYTRRLQKNCWR